MYLCKYSQKELNGNYTVSEIQIEENSQEFGELIVVRKTGSGTQAKNQRIKLGTVKLDNLYEDVIRLLSASPKTLGPRLDNIEFYIRGQFIYYSDSATFEFDSSITDRFWREALYLCWCRFGQQRINYGAGLFALTIERWKELYAKHNTLTHPIVLKLLQSIDDRIFSTDYHLPNGSVLPNHTRNRNFASVKH